MPCVYCLYTLLKVVSYSGLSVLSMSMMSFQNKVGWFVSSIHVYFGFVLTLQSPLFHSYISAVFLEIGDHSFKNR